MTDTATVAEDAEPATIYVLTNDLNPAGYTLTITSVTQPTNGTVVIAGDSLTLTYEPAADYCNTPPGTTLDTFTYTSAPTGSTATVSVTVTCENDAPTDILLDDNSVSEGLPAGTLVGSLSTTDVDPGDTFTYTLVAGAGDTDNASFQIVGNQLQTSAVFDLETKASYTVRIRSTDAGGLFTEKQFTINVTDTNDAPTDIALSPASVNENQPLNTTVGTFTTTDPDTGDSHTYTLEAGVGSTDNASFQIVGDQLQTNAIFNFEVKNSYSIRVRSTDVGGLFVEEVFTITVNNVNEQPTDIALDDTTIDENQPSGTAVGNFSTTDVDAGDTFTYTLEAGIGSTDNASFQIVGNQLRTAAVLDFETKTSYSIRVRSTDAGGLFFEKQFTITLTAVNEQPTDISLSGTSVAEDAPLNTPVGNFSTTDADAGDTFTYTLVAGVGDTDNGSFTIVGNQLQTNALFNFETKSSYSIRVRSADAGGLSFEKAFTINITNVNEAPTDIALSNATVAEGQASGTAVGNLTTTDPDTGDTFTYTLVAGAGSTDNGSFAIVGNQLQTGAVLDFETKSSYSIRVRSTDAGGLSFEKVFTITVTNVNETPTDIALSNATIAEGQPSATPVGNFSTTDSDTGDTFTYTLVAGAGSTDNGSFTIVGNQLRTAAVLDFETKSSYSIRVRSTDAGGLFFEKVFTITVTNVNEAPTDIALSPAVVNEAQPSATPVGNFSTTDPDAGDTFTYTLVAGAGSTDNGSFAIVGNQLQTSAVFDFETKSSYSIRVRSTDAAGLFFEKIFTITVVNVNEAPTDIALSAASVAENQPASTAVGNFSTTDPDTGDTFTYTLVAGTGSTDNGSFAIAGNQLRTAAMFDFETKSSYSIRVRSTDSGGLFTEKVFVISVTNANEAPTAIALSNANVDENQPVGTAVGNFSTTDPDAGDTFTYTLVAGAGSTDNGSFQIVGNQLRTAVMFNFEAKSSYTIRVRSTDAGGLSVEQQFTIDINNLPEAPIAGNDAFDTVGNTLLEMDATSDEPQPKVYFNGNVLSNDVDPDGPTTLTVSLVSSTPGSVVTLNNDGTFTYVPPAGATGTDSFTYNVSDGVLTSAVPGTVTITLKGRVWYVKNNQAAGGLGRSTDPFDTLVEAQTASADNDTIYIFRGDGTITNQNTGIILKNGQRLIGEGVALTIPVSVNGGGATTTLRTITAAHPMIHNNTDDAGEDHGVSIQATAANRTNIEIRGLNISGRDNGIDVTATGANNAGVTITDSAITSDGTTGLEGIDVNAAGTGTVTVTVDVNNVSGRGNAFDARTSAAGALRINFSNNPSVLSQTASGIVIDGSGGGVTTITGFGGNSVHENTPGTGISVTSATFDVTPGGTFQTLNAGNTRVGLMSGNGVGGSGMVLTNVQGDLSFTDLDIFADGGAGLRASSPAAYTGSAGLQLVVSSPGVAVIEATGGPAVDIATAAIDLQLSSLKSTNSTTTGVALNSVPGTFTAGSGSTISNITSAAGTAFQVGSSSAGVTYNGIINTTQGTGVSLTGNSGTIGFTGTLTLSTGANPAFVATGGGTVTATDTSNTLATTTGTALNVANTTIGAGGLKFRSISAGTAASGPANGIVLNNTGSSGGLTVSGTGTAGSGGTIQRAGTGVSLTSTRDVSLSHMQLNDFTDFGIRGTSVVNFTLANSVVNGTNGDNAAADEGSVRFNELTGSASITGSSISGSIETNLRVVNTSGSLNRLTVAGTTIGTNSTVTGDDGLFFEAQSTAVMNATVQNSFFTASRGDLAQFNNAGTGTMDIVITNTAFSDNHPAIVAGGGGVVLGGISGTMTYNVSSNTFRDSTGTGFAVSCGGATAVCTGRIENNQVGVAAVANSGSTNASGIAVVNSGGGTMTSLINNNTIRQYNNHGILLQAGQTGGNPTNFNITVTNNTIGNPGTINTDFNGIHLNNGTLPGENFTSCVDIRANSIAGAGKGVTAPNNADFRLRQRQSTTVRLPGYAGANNNDAAVVSFVTGNQTTVTTGASSNTVGSGGGGFVGGASCPTP